MPQMLKFSIFANEERRRTGARRSCRVSGVVIFDFLATVHIEIVFLIVGLWGVLTSAFGYCPFNGLLNRNSCAIDPQAAVRS